MSSNAASLHFSWSSLVFLLIKSSINTIAYKIKILWTRNTNREVVLCFLVHQCSALPVALQEVFIGLGVLDWWLALHRKTKLLHLLLSGQSRARKSDSKTLNKSWITDDNELHFFFSTAGLARPALYLELLTYFLGLVWREVTQMQLDKTFIDPTWEMWATQQKYGTAIRIKKRYYNIQNVKIFCSLVEIKASHKESNMLTGYTFLCLSELSVAGLTSQTACFLCTLHLYFFICSVTIWFYRFHAGSPGERDGLPSTRPSAKHKKHTRLPRGPGGGKAIRSQRRRCAFLDALLPLPPPPRRLHGRRVSLAWLIRAISVAAHWNQRGTVSPHSQVDSLPWVWNEGASRE